MRIRQLFIRHPWALFALAAALPLAACDKSPDATPTPDPPKAPAARASASSAKSSSPAAPSAVASAPSSAAPADSAAAPVADPSDSVKLLSAGAEPRRELRYKFKPGKLERVSLLTSTKLTIEAMGQKASPPSVPEIQMDANVKVVSLRPDGRARRELVIEKVKAPDVSQIPAAQREELTSSLKQLEQLRGKDLMDQRGRVEHTELDTSNITDPQLKALMGSLQQAFSQMGAPLPEQAIGVGAKWQVSTSADSYGLKLNQVTTYELTKIDGDSVETHVEIKQSAPRGKISMPGMPPGVDAEVMSLKSSGEGRLSFSLLATVPRGELQNQTRVEIAAKMAGMDQSTTMNFDVRVKFKPR